MRTLQPGRFAGTDPALVVSTPSGHVQQIVLGEQAILVAGRDPEVAISIPDESVSRRHAEFRARPLGVRDLGSTNGTRVQGSPIGPGWISLDVGSVVELGDSVVLVRGTSAPAAEVLVPPRRLGRGSEPPPRSPAGAGSHGRGERGEPGEPGKRGAPGRAARADRHGVIAVAPAMQHLYSLIELVAPSRLSVLILGETGAGKEVVARALHAASDRRDRRLLTLNCAALAATLLESELFGHEKGAFTGAVAAKPGLFEAASGGTVFLDEIGELPLETQAKLLRVLESGEVLRIGALAPIAVDVRFVAATHRDLAGLAERGQFRLDLLFRLAGVTLEVPPLRDRREDLAPLARAFLAQARPGSGGASDESGESDERDENDESFTAAALAALHRHPWPGNVRELKSTVERAALLSRGAAIDVAHLTFGVGVALGSALSAAVTAAKDVMTSPPSMPSISSSSPPPPTAASPLTSASPATRPAAPAPGAPATSASPAAPFRDEVASLERERILAALEACGGNQSRAARSLGISRATMVRRLEAYGVTRPRK